MSRKINVIALVISALLISNSYSENVNIDLKDNFIECSGSTDVSPVIDKNGIVVFSKELSCVNFRVPQPINQSHQIEFEIESNGDHNVILIDIIDLSTRQDISEYEELKILRYDRISKRVSVMHPANESLITIHSRIYNNGSILLRRIEIFETKQLLQLPAINDEPIKALSESHHTHANIIEFNPLFPEPDLTSHLPPNPTDPEPTTSPEDPEGTTPPPLEIFVAANSGWLVTAVVFIALTVVLFLCAVIMVLKLPASA